MSNPKYIVIHRADKNNVGDIASNPLQYFLNETDYKVIDILDVYNSPFPSNVPVIVGGGGLLENDLFRDILSKLHSSSDKIQLMKIWNTRWELQNPDQMSLYEEFIEKHDALIKECISKLEENKSPRFLWGVGHNAALDKKNKTKKLVYPDWLAYYDLIGVRDWLQTMPWIPCASCMHPALRKEYTIKNDVIWFEHKKQLISDFGKDSIPRFVNSGDNIEQTIELLGSANIILTNSYHGAYWGTLLKKRVIVVNPWSTKFFNLKHSPTIIDDHSDWKHHIDNAKIYNNALDECIEKTENFWQAIQSRS